MALILSCITPEYVFQVSDRRLMWGSGPNKGKIKEDNRNKAVVLYNRVTFGYTGLANLPYIKTDDWLLEVLARVKTHNLTHSFNFLAEEATKQFRGIAFNAKIKRHAFISAGWARLTINGPKRPFLCSISNALDDQWHWLNKAQNDFRVRIVPLPSDTPLQFYSAGANIGSRNERSVRRSLQRCVQKGVGPNGYIRVLAECIRGFSSPQNGVGKSLLAVSLPLAATLQAGGMSMPLDGRIPFDRAACLYIPEGVDEGILYGPHMVNENMLMIGAFVRYGQNVEPQPEIPPWERGPLILSKRVGGSSEGDSIRPALADDYKLSKGWGLVAEARGWPKNAPSPCLMYIGIETENLISIQKDPKYLVVTSPEFPADTLPTNEWISRLQEWLEGAGISAGEVTSFR